VATIRLTTPAYWKFESIPLQNSDGMGTDLIGGQ
jgi:hypothetical protein